MVYLLQRLVQDTQGKSSATSKPEDEPETLMSMSMKHFQLRYMPQLLALTIIFFFLSTQAKAKGKMN